MMNANELANWPQALRATARDIEKLADGYVPGDEELLACPGIHLWALDEHNDWIVWGWLVKEHQTGVVPGLSKSFSLPYIAIDRDRRWVLTINGFYRLLSGRRFARAK